MLPACDVVALPSFYDGLPNVALEAAALGIPLLASDAGGLADLVDDEVGFSFAAGDDAGCRAALVALASCADEDLRHKGEAARERVLRDYRSDDERDRYVQLFGDAVARRPPSDSSP